MNKIEFLSEIRERLKGYPRDEVDNSIQYYSEMIEDRVEDGMSEDAAVASLGDINEIVKNIKKNMPLKSVIKEKFSQGKEKLEESNVSVLTILMLIIFFPFWFPFACIMFSLYGVFFLITWILDGAFFVAGGASIFAFVACIVTAIVNIVRLQPLAALGAFGGGILLLGAGILLAVIGVCFSKAIIKMFGGILKGIKGLIIGKKKGE